jgi:hypothetical protein
VVAGDDQAGLRLSGDLSRQAALRGSEVDVDEVEPKQEQIIWSDDRD